MNRWMLAAAGALLLTTWVHVYLGGPEIHHVIQVSDLPPDLRALSAVLWHAVTIALLVFAAGCIWLARTPNPALVLLIGAIQVGYAGLFLFYGVTRLGTLWVMPQWIIFLLVPALMVIGLRRDRAPRTGVVES